MNHTSSVSKNILHGFRFEQTRQPRPADKDGPYPHIPVQQSLSAAVGFVYIQPGETIASVKLDKACGGKGFNQAAALAKAGAKVYLAGLVGSDGGELLETAQEFGVDCRFVQERDNRTGHAIIQVDKNGQNSIVLYGGTNRMWTTEYIDSVLDSFEKGDVLILQNEINGIEDILEKAYARGISIVLNPSPFEDCILSWQLEKVSLFFINEVEGEQMTQKSEPKDILEQMLFQYPNAAVVLNLGEKGAWYADREERYFCPAQKVKAVDTTAAGDTFTGYFLMAQEKGFSAEQCLSIAAQASAIAVSRKGASVSVPTGMVCVSIPAFLLIAADMISTDTTAMPTMISTSRTRTTWKKELFPFLLTELPLTAVSFLSPKTNSTMTLRL